MSEIPELPQDILNYLGNFIKPKKYTLINKFCRDSYFQKNGVTIRLVEKYPSYDLLTKYRIKILGPFDIHTTKKLGQKIGNVESFAKNVIKIKCNCSAVIYDMLVDIFPNLVEFNGIITAYESIYQKILSHRKIPGVIISWSAGLANKGVNTLIGLGYNFSVDNMYGTEEIPTNKVVILHLSEEKQTDISQYPNLEKLYVHYKYVEMDPLVDAIKKHKSIKKIILDPSWYNSGIIDNRKEVSVKFSKCDTRYCLDDLTKYNTIKNRTPGFIVHSSSALEKLMDLEKSSEIKKRPKLFIENGINIPDLDELVRLFRVEITASARTIAKFYMVSCSLEKFINIGNKIIMVCRTKTGKFNLRQDIEY